MNKILLLATMFASVVLLGCSNTDIGTEPQKDGIIFDGGTETKTTMDGSYVFSWVKDTDKIGIFAKNATGAIYTQNAVEHKVTESKHTSPFAAAAGNVIDWSGKGTHTFYAYHPYVSASDYANVSIPLSSTQTQAAANDNSHVGLNAIMTASTTADPALGNNVSLQFAQQTSFFEFRVSADAANAATIQSITVKTNAPISGTGINYDFTTNDYTVVGGVNEATLTFTTPMPVTTTVQKGWLSFLPGTFTSLTFTITYSDGKIQDIVKPNPSYTFGKAKLIPVDLKAAPAVTPPGPSPLALCSITELNNSWAYLSAFTVGDKDVTITKTADNAYIDKTAEVAANVTVGGNVSATVGGNEQNNITAWVDWNADGNLDASEIVGKSEGPAASLTFSFPGKSGMPSGIYYMRIGTNYGDNQSGCDNVGAVTRDESRTACDIAINYTSNEDPSAPAKGRIVAADGLTASVTATADVTKNFTVSLTKASKEASTFTLVAKSNNNLSGILSTSSVIIPAGQTSVNASITFSKSVFVTDAAATVTVTATNTNSPALEMINSDIVYDVKGPVSTQDLKMYIYDTDVQYFTSADTYKDVSISLAGQNTNKATSDITLTPTITGGTLGVDYELPSGASTTIATGTKSASFDIRILKTGAGKDLTIDFATTKVTFYYPNTTSTTVSSLVYNAPTTPANYLIDVTIPTTVTNNNWEGYSISTTGTVAVPIFVSWTATADGADCTNLVNFENLNPIALTDGSASGYVKFYDGLKGKTVTITFTSKDSNFIGGAATLSKTVTVN